MLELIVLGITWWFLSRYWKYGGDKHEQKGHFRVEKKKYHKIQGPTLFWRQYLTIKGSTSLRNLRTVWKQNTNAAGVFITLAQKENRAKPSYLYCQHEYRVVSGWKWSQWSYTGVYVSFKYWYWVARVHLLDFSNTVSVLRRNPRSACYGMYIKTLQNRNKPWLAGVRSALLHTKLQG